MIMNPLLFYPIMFVGSIVAMLYSIGLGPVFVPAAKQTINIGLRSAGVPFQL